MGASVIVRASGPLLAAKYKIAGVAALDVVEGMARDAAFLVYVLSCICCRLHFRCTPAHAQSP
jgi:hypothetical protein